MQSKTLRETLLAWYRDFQNNRLVLEEVEVYLKEHEMQQNMNPSAIHIPTFVWSVLAVIVGLILYHMFFGRT